MKTTLFAVMPDGRKVNCYTLSDKDTEVKIIEYGARVASINFCGTECVCGFNTLDGYLADTEYHGSIVGRYANRIADGIFTLNGIKYTLAKNEKGISHLHGGNCGFSNRLWEFKSQTENSVTLKLFSPDGDEGYPGNLTVFVTYTLADNALTIDYSATTDADTVINLTNHSYFNIGGVGKENVCDQTLTMYTKAIAEVDAKLIPSGKLIDVKGSAFDFNSPKKIGADINADDEQLKIGGGYDHGFLLSQNNPAAILHSDKSGITMKIFTTESGIQMYTGNFMTEDNPFFGTEKQVKNGAVALECNCLPDSPNHPEFKSCVLHADETYTQTTTYMFSK